MAKKISKTGLNLIKEFEGCYLKAYKDPVGVWTIGYGITNSDKSITGETIRSGLEISQKTADKWLEDSLNKKYTPLVLKYDDKYNWNQNELDALVSFAYNIGSIDQLTAKGTRSRSTIASKILQYNKAGGRELRGLTRRRRAEHDLFVKPYSGEKKAESSEKKNSKSLPNKTLKVTAKSGLNMRSDAGTNKPKVLAIPYKKKVEWIEQKTKTINNVEWYKISYRGETGYAMAKWLREV